MTIEELIEEHGREEIELQVHNLKCCAVPLGKLTPLGQDILEALVETEQVERFNGDEWVLLVYSPTRAYTYRIKSDYVLPDTEPEVFWGERENEMPPFYYLPSGDTGSWDILAGWANDNGWEFHGFFHSKLSESDIGRTDPFTKGGGKAIGIMSFAKFIKENNA